MIHAGERATVEFGSVKIGRTVIKNRSNRLWGNFLEDRWTAAPAGANFTRSVVTPTGTYTYRVVPPAGYTTIGPFQTQLGHTYNAMQAISLGVDSTSVQTGYGVKVSSGQSIVFDTFRRTPSSTSRPPNLFGIEIYGWGPNKPLNGNNIISVRGGNPSTTLTDIQISNIIQVPEFSQPNQGTWGLLVIQDRDSTLSSVTISLPSVSGSNPTETMYVGGTVYLGGGSNLALPSPYALNTPPPPGVPVPPPLPQPHPLNAPPRASKDPVIRFLPVALGETITQMSSVRMWGESLAHDWPNPPIANNTTSRTHSFAVSNKTYNYRMTLSANNNVTYQPFQALQGDNRIVNAMQAPSLGLTSVQTGCGLELRSGQSLTLDQFSKTPNQISIGIFWFGVNMPNVGNNILNVYVNGSSTALQDIQVTAQPSPGGYQAPEFQTYHQCTWGLLIVEDDNDISSLRIQLPSRTDGTQEIIGIGGTLFFGGKNLTIPAPTPTINTALLNTFTPEEVQALLNSPQRLEYFEAYLQEDASSSDQILVQEMAAQALGETYIPNIANTRTDPLVDNIFQDLLVAPNFVEVSQSYSFLEMQSDLQNDVVPLMYKKPKRTMLSPKTAVWFQPFGSSTRQVNTNSRVHAQMVGCIMGMDYALLPWLRVGLMSGWSHQKIHISNDYGGQNEQHFYSGFYGRFGNPDGLGLIGSFGGIVCINRYRGRRNMPALDLIAHNKHSGISLNPMVQIGYGIGMNSFIITPFAGITYGIQAESPYKEYGAYPFDLYVPGYKMKTLRKEIGLILQNSWSSANLSWQHTLQISGIHQQNQPRQTTRNVYFHGSDTLTFTTDPAPFSIDIQQKNRWALACAIGTNIKASSDWSFSALCRGEFSHKNMVLGGFLQIKKEW